MGISADEVLEKIGSVQEILDAHDGVVNVVDTTDGNIMISLEGGCTGCSSTPMTAMQIYYSLKKLPEVNDVIFINGELPEYMRSFIDDKMRKEAEEQNNGDDSEPQGEIVWALFLFILLVVLFAQGVWIRTERHILSFDVHFSRDGKNDTEKWERPW